MSTILFKNLSIKKMYITPIEKKDFYTSDIYLNNVNLSSLNLIGEKLKLIEINKTKLKFEFLKNTELFYKFIMNLDNKVITYIINNTPSIYGFKCNIKKVKHLYESKIKLTNNSFCPIINANYEKIKLIDSEGKKIEMKDIKIGSIILPVFNIKNIIFEQHKIKLNIHITLMQVISQEVINNVENDTDSNFSNTSINSEYSSFTDSNYYKSTIKNKSIKSRN